MKLTDTWTCPSLHQLFSLIVCNVTLVSRGAFHWESRTWTPQCTKVNHSSPKLSLSTSPSSIFVPTCRFCCLLGCLSLCVPVRSMQTLFFHQPSQPLSHSASADRQACARIHTHTHTHIHMLCNIWVMSFIFYFSFFKTSFNFYGRISTLNITKLL